MPHCGAKAHVFQLTSKMRPDCCMVSARLVIAFCPLTVAIFTFAIIKELFCDFLKHFISFLLTLQINNTPKNWTCQALFKNNFRIIFLHKKFTKFSLDFPWQVWYNFSPCKGIFAFFDIKKRTPCGVLLSNQKFFSFRQGNLE